ncbi:MAG: WD40 repeat domain-containing protein [Verrucomicrobiota bacterium]
MIARIVFNLALSVPFAIAAEELRLQDLSAIRQADFNHDGSRIILRTRDGIAIWNTASGAPIPGDLGLFNEAAKGSYFVSPSARRILVGFDAGGLRVFDFETARAVSPMIEVSFTKKWSPKAAFVPDESRVVIFDRENDRPGSVIDLESEQLVAELDIELPDEDSGPWIEFSKNCEFAFLLDEEARLHRYETSNWVPSGDAMTHPFDPAVAVSFGFTICEDGRYAVTFDRPGENGPQGRLQLWDARTGLPLGEFLSARNGFSAQFFRNDQSLQLLALPGRGENRVLNIPSLDLSFIPPRHDEIDANYALLSRDKQILHTWGYDRSIQRIDAVSGKELGALFVQANIKAVLSGHDSLKIWLVLDRWSSSANFCENFSAWSMERR